MFPQIRTKPLLYITGGVLILAILLALSGCGTLNPSWGGSRW